MIISFLNQQNFRLKLTNQFPLLIERSSRSSISQIVSIIGDTHSGKTTTLRSLINSEKPLIAKARENAPTTANVNCYDSENFNTEVGNIRFLDFEGENGGKPPTSLTSKMLSIFESMGNLFHL